MFDWDAGAGDENDDFMGCFMVHAHAHAHAHRMACSPATTTTHTKTCFMTQHVHEFDETCSVTQHMLVSGKCKGCD